MQSRPTKFTIKMGGKVITLCNNENRQETQENDQITLEGPTVPSNSDSKGTNQNILNSSSSEYSSSSDDENTPSSHDDSQRQMVLYTLSNPITPVKNNPQSLSRQLVNTRKVLRIPEVDAFTVQCANCHKWRLIPDQETYEMIREHITYQPFLCATTRQWGHDVSCDDPADIEQDGTRIWSIDKPNIAKPPPGWKRLLRLRSEGSSKFADVYYSSPTGSKFSSMPKVMNYLKLHPEHAEGIETSRFSFQIPKPLQENYVKNRHTPVEPIQWACPEESMDLEIVKPIAWAGPEENRNGAPPAKKAKRDDFNCL